MRKGPLNDDPGDQIDDVGRMHWRQCGQLGCDWCARIAGVLLGPVELPPIRFVTLRGVVAPTDNP